MERYNDSFRKTQDFTKTYTKVKRNLLHCKGRQMRIIAGPCQHETLELSLQIAEECKRVCDLHNIEYIFKASFDKANRSSMQGKRGVGTWSNTSSL